MILEDVSSEALGRAHVLGLEADYDLFDFVAHFVVGVEAGGR